MILDAKRLSRALNDQEINYVADVFLANLGFDRKADGYRTLKNAMLLGVFGLPPVRAYVALDFIEGGGKGAANTVRELISSLPVPISARFNIAYVLPQSPYRRTALPVTMQEQTPDDALEFLSAAFSYILFSNYNKSRYFKQ